MPHAAIAGAVSTRRPVGRPRRLTLRQIVGAGVELGLEGLSLSAVALRLGVSVGTIYTYVANRDALLRLVTAALSQRPVVVDDGQHWADIVRAYAAHNFALLRREPVLLANIVSGAIDPDEGFPELEDFIALLVARGFTPGDALALYHDGSQIAVGAAVRAAMAHAWERRGQNRAAHVARVLAERADAFPHLSGLRAALADDMLHFDHRPTLERLLTQVATGRGETLPAAPHDAARAPGGDGHRGVDEREKA